jgi:SAM-dependent methyltransferase
MSALIETDPSPARALLSVARCVACGRSLRGATDCLGCGRSYPVVDGVLQALGPLEGSNAVAASFYDGARWPRFKVWENVFLWFQGPGVDRARRQVLRHLPTRPEARVLEVGIGDGANRRLLSSAWTVFGVDLAASRLAACQAREPEMRDRLALAEAERLPFDDATFDAVFTVGGVNYFRDPAAALVEMRRVARPGAVMIAADERPDLYRFSVPYALGLRRLDRAILRSMGLDDAFIEMVYTTPPRVERAAREVWPNHRRVPIWNRLGYCLIDVRPE